MYHLMRYFPAAGVLISLSCSGAAVESIRQRDLDEALIAFRGNIAAIHRRDVEGYLSHYLDSPELVIAGADSLRRGFTPFAAARRASSDWPDTLIAGEPNLVWLAPGVVYGAYPYTVVQNGDSASGWSERVLVKTGGAWKVAVTSRIDRCRCDN
jgi:hypothetical protein